MTQGNTKDALAAAKQARGILQNLATANPDSTDCQFDLAVGDIKIGYVLEAQGDLAGALNAYRESQVITTALTQKDPNSTLRQNALALSDMRIGDVLRSYRQILVTA